MTDAAERDRQSATVGTAGGSALRVVGIVLQSAFGMALVPLSLRFLGAEVYGVWIVVRSIGAYFMLAAEIGIGQTIVNLGTAAVVAGDQRRLKHIAATSFAVYCALALTAWCVLVGLTTVVPLMHAFVPNSSDLKNVDATLFLYAALALASIPLTVFPAVLLALRQVPLRHLIETASQPFLFAMAVLALALGTGLGGVAVATALGFFVVPLTAAVLVRIRHAWALPGPRDLRSSLVRPIVINSSLFFALGLAPLIQRTVGNLLVARVGALDQVPVMFALTLVYRYLAWSILDVVSRVAQPYIVAMDTRGNPSAVRAFVALSTKVTALGAFLIVTLVVGFGPEVARAYLHVTVDRTLLLLMGVSLALDSLFIPTVNVLVALNRHRGLAASQITYALVSVAAAAVGAGVLPERPLHGVATGFVLAWFVAQLPVVPLLAIRPAHFGFRDYANGVIGRSLALMLFLLPQAVAYWIAPQAAPVVVGLCVLVALFVFWWIVLAQTERSELRTLAPALRPRSSST